MKEAVIRKFKEETSMNVTVGGIIDGRIEETFDRIKVIVAFEVTSAEGEIRLNSEKRTAGLMKFPAIPFTIVPSICKIKTLIHINSPTKTIKLQKT